MHELIKQITWSKVEGSITNFLEVEFYKKIRNFKGEGNVLYFTDIDVRKRGEQTGLDTLVVHALTYEWKNIFSGFNNFCLNHFNVILLFLINLF